MVRPGETPGETALILVVDDNPDNLEIISTRLEYKGYDVVTAQRGDEAISLIHEHGPDLMLLDIMMPDMDGYEVARRVRADGEIAYLPIIVVTARDSTEDKVTGLDAGADDYLTKPINFPELEARVRSMLRIKRLQDQLEEKNRELEELSISDGLTGLYNHRHLHELLQEEFERSKRTEEPISVVMFDLDRFKQVNDTYGHQAGDQVLKGLADILRETAREIDRLGRYGGEEFLAILPDSDPEAGMTFAERVRETVADQRFDIRTNGPLEMTISAGVATYPHDGPDGPRRLVHYADQALYSAKNSGRNRVVRFEPGMADD
ncbi:MAG: diguanylate cyclase [Gemmatimonadetes bacterium]|nr:diguanylate cyclase [Gemmatimonadota bacterium]NIU75560.1 diguanylate cyclase [Gammaproteobacteria bacterium]NIX44139.1 diguanylate cyclase [Gemmatimonadota bacterium]